MFLKADYRRCILVSVLLGLVGCNKPLEDSVAEKIESENQLVNSAAANTQGKKLTEVAGKATMPVDTTTVTQKKIPENAEPYVGRYQSSISCADPLMKCKEGSGDLIINLLADGTAHSSIIHLGQITFDSDSYYHKDSWSYDEQHHQVILHRSNGVKFFYNVNQDQSLQMDLDKIANASEQNKQYFAEGHPFPQQAYRLVKESTPVKTNKS